jgi:hypothetical protein
MRPLVYEEIDRLWHQNADIDPGQIQQLVDTIGGKQPYIVGYLLAAGDDILEQSEREVIFFIGVIIWYIIDSLEFTLPEISLEQLIAHEEKNFKMLEYLAGEPESQFLNTVDRIMGGYNQSVFLKYVIDKIMEEPEKGVDLIENHLGIMAIYLKTILDCVDETTY